VAQQQRRLRSVTPDEKPASKARKRRKTITQAAATGTVREQLEALRDRIAKTVEDPNCPPRDLASLSRRLMEITKEIEAIDAQALEEGDGSEATPDEAWTAV
jgi:hypothetical protein